MTIQDVTNLLPDRFGVHSSRFIRQVNKIIVHSVTGFEDIADLIKNDTITLGLDTVRFHSVIDKNSNIFKTNYINFVTQHCEGENTSAIGICLLNDNPSDKELTSLHFLIESYRFLTKKELMVYAHSQFNNKTCPGKVLTEHIKKTYPIVHERVKRRKRN